MQKVPQLQHSKELQSLSVEGRVAAGNLSTAAFQDRRSAMMLVKPGSEGECVCAGTW